uniref:Uncharacterized mitochondrial protein AtMg00820-like n=1 Tax=Nicotiana tabacum TaxID=4097 RepID=A0A1S4BI05_TOBAC|nr:PREDICTED: uncharacterized mitochondrial protein AtMg00820-like [Nicotiana tabacum]
MPLPAFEYAQRQGETPSEAVIHFYLEDQLRKSSSTVKEPVWIQDYVCNGSLTSSTSRPSCKYPMQEYLSHDGVSTKYTSYLSKITSLKEPMSYEEATTDPKWVEAMDQELTALKENGTWSLVDLPTRKVSISCKWIFKIKYKANGEVERFKVRFVEKGHNQIEGFDYQETFSLVVKMVTVRVVLALAATHNLNLHQMDVYNAFLQGDLSEEVYMCLPQGFHSQRGKYVGCINPFMD